MAFSSFGAAFQNLHFDSPSIKTLEEIPGPLPDQTILRGNITDLLPGWTAFYDRVKYEGYMTFRGAVLTVPALLHSPHSGNEYYLEFISGPLPGFRHEFSIEQIGLIPPEAWELRVGGSAYGRLSINGVELERQVIPGFNMGSYNVRAFAGQEVKLEIKSLGSDGFKGDIGIDIIGFAIPEPSTYLLLGCGCTLIALTLTGSKRGSNNLRRTVVALDD